MTLPLLLAGGLVSCQAPAAQTIATPNANMPAQPANSIRSFFPNVTTIQEERAPLRLRGVGEALTIRSFRFQAAEPGAFWRNGFRCGAVVEGVDVQAITTIGEGWTETLSCDRLVDGALLAGRNATCLVLIYYARTPNGAGRTAVVLKRSKGGNAWHVDEPEMERLSLVSEPTTVGSIRSKLQCRL